MKFAKFVIPILIITVIAGAFYLQTKPVSKPEQAMKYYCPMHPNYTSDRPGDCPICHMKLIPMEKKGDKDSQCLMHECPMLKNGEDCPMLLLPKGQGGADCPYCSKHLHGDTSEPIASAGQTVEIPEADAKKIGVRIENVQIRNLRKDIPIQARVAYDPELYQAQLDYLQKTKRFQRPAYVIDPFSSESAERGRLELVKMGVSGEMIEELKTWKKPDARLIGGDPNGELWVYAYFNEEDSSFAKPGALLEITVSGALPLQTPIKYVDGIVQGASRTIRARAIIDNKSAALKPDMYLQASLIADLGDRLSIPGEALLHAGDAPYVFVRKEGNLFEPRTIHIGQKAGIYYEVLSGLKEGESVIVSGNFLVDSESRIQSALSQSSATPAKEHAHD